MTTIIKGEQYILPIIIKLGPTTITPALVQDVRIQVADVLKEYSKSEIAFNSTTNKWEYPLTQEQLRECSILTDVQVGIKQNNQIRYATKQKIFVADNIVIKDW